MANQKKRRQYSEDQLGEAVRTSYSYNQVVHQLQVSDSGANFSTIRRDVLRLNLDTSHFGTNPKPRISVQSIEDFLKCPHKRGTEIKRFILCHDVLPNICAECGLGPEWNGKQLTLQLDHINGDSRDHRLENLRILCPNCHSQTPTFCRKKEPPKSETPKPHKPRKRAIRPLKFEVSKEDLERLIADHKNWSLIGRLFGVSGNAIKKRAKLLKILEGDSS